MGSADVYTNHNRWTYGRGRNVEHYNAPLLRCSELHSLYIIYTYAVYTIYTGLSNTWPLECMYIALKYFFAIQRKVIYSALKIISQN